MIEWKFLLTPFARSMTTKSSNFGISYIGYANYYIFGIRVAKNQMTKPWE